MGEFVQIFQIRSQLGERRAHAASAAAIADSPNPDATDRVLRASCRISAGNARGSGVIFDADEDNYRVLTNAHVVGRVGNRVRLEFEHSGYRSRPIAGRVVRSHIARTTSIDLAIVELPRSAFPGPMPVVPLAVGDAQSNGLLDGETVLTVGAQGGAAVSLQRGHVVRQTRGLIYYKPEALPGRSGSPLFNDNGSRVIGLVAWRTGDGHGLAMNAAAVRSFVRGEVAEVETALPDDAIPLWQSSTMLVLVTSEGCRPCELQKQAIPDDVRYQTFDIEYVNEKGYQVDSTPTFMVFVDRKLQEQRSGLLRGDRLRAFLDRWGFNDSETEGDDADRTDDDFNPWNNPRRWNRGPIRDRIDNAKDRFAWWLVGKWLGFAGGGAAVLFPWLFFIYRALRKLRSSDGGGCPANKRPTRRRSSKRPRKPTAKRRKTNRT
ncbi:MAG: trypsin-like peptidase domain-containing protein [Rubripirellula sp.]